MNFNGCKIAIQGLNGSYFDFNNEILIKDATEVAINLKNNSIVDSPGISGASHSSFYIVTSERGFQVDNSKAIIENAYIVDTRYGVIAKNNSFLDFNKSTIDGQRYLNTNTQSFGAYISDGTVVNMYQSSVTGYTGGTGGTQTAMIASVKGSTIFVESDAKRTNINTVANGSSSLGFAVVDVNQGNKTNNGSSLFYYSGSGGDN